MHILFENFRNVEGYLMQRLMCIACHGEWIHCEIIFDELDIKTDEIRASSWDEKGVEFRKWEDFNPDFYELYPLPSHQWKEAYQFCKNHEGLEYDRLGVMGMMYKIPTFNTDKKFCSEMCFEVVDLFTDLKLPEKPSSLISPLMMRRMIINQGIKPVPLSVLTK